MLRILEKMKKIIVRFYLNVYKMELYTLKNVNNCLNAKITFYKESVGQFSNLALNIVCSSSQSHKVTPPIRQIRRKQRGD